MKRLSGLLAAAATGVAGVAFATSAAAPAAADPLSGCTTSSGVLVVVDFRPMGGQIARGCDASITTGYDALYAAGFTTQGTTHDGTGFVCRIDGEPKKIPGSCVVTPPANDYWSYWHSDAGQSGWTYSKLGAQSYHPHSGSIDAWVFGATDIGGTDGGPTFTPGQVRAGTAGAPPPSAPKSHRPRSSTAARAPDRHHSSTPVAGDPANATPPSTAGSSSRPAAATRSRPARASATAPATSSSSGPGPPSASAPGPAPTIVDASSVADKTKSSSGSALPVVIGLALALVLGGGAGWTVLRRRRAESTDQ